MKPLGRGVVTAAGCLRLDSGAGVGTLRTAGTAGIVGPLRTAGTAGTAGTAVTAGTSRTAGTAGTGLKPAGMSSVEMPVVLAALSLSPTSTSETAATEDTEDTEDTEEPGTACITANLSMSIDK